MPSAARISRTRSLITRRGIRRKSYRWQRERMVIGTLWLSVVAKMNFTWAGGSSRVFRNALKAPVDSMWTSSTMTTLKRSRAGRYGIDS